MIENLERLFDDKIAANDEFKYNGGDGGDKWRIKIRGYWVSKCPTLMTILDWAERHDEKQIIDGSWRGKSWRRRKIRDEQIDRINELIWAS